MGTVAFAISGAMLAIERKMDLFGIVFLGIVTAAGGGFYQGYDTGDRAACHVFQSNGPAAGNSVIAGSVCAGCMAL